MPRTRWTALAAVLLLLASACRSSDDSEATTDAGDAPTATGAPGPTGFGDLDSPCGEGDAAGATDVGVTDDAINIGTMSDSTATAQPGLNQELWDASRAFVAWCNEQGGINGRPIEYTEYEAKLFEAQQRTIEACDREFMLVGGGAAFDDAVATERMACGLPEVPAYLATVPATEAELSWPPAPIPFDELPAGEAFYLAEQHPDAVKNAAILTANFPAAKNIAIRAQRAYEAAGWEFVDEQLYNPAGEANWTGIVTGLRSSGVEALFYSGTVEPLAAFLQAAAEQGWTPTITIGTSTIFTPGLPTEAGAAADGVMTYTNVVPFDDVAEGSATAQYLSLLDTYADGAEPKLLGVNSISAWLLWATAAKACGAELTRACVGEQLGQVTEWTAGGLHAPSDPAAGRGPSCFVLVQVQDGEWARVHPEEDFDCDPAYTVPTAGDYQ